MGNPPGSSGVIVCCYFQFLFQTTFVSGATPHNTINQIKYFTARVNARPCDPDQPQRQQTYLRALETLPNLSIVFGPFLTSNTKMLKVGCDPSDAASYVQVIETEEKGSDVNLATHMLYDAFKGNFECAAVISKDSDLLEPIRIIREELGLSVGLLNPGKKLSFALVPHADFHQNHKTRRVNGKSVPRSASGREWKFRKPASW